MAKIIEFDNGDKEPEFEYTKALLDMELRDAGLDDARILLVDMDGIIRDVQAVYISKAENAVYLCAEDYD